MFKQRHAPWGLLKTAGLHVLLCGLVLSHTLPLSAETRIFRCEDKQGHPVFSQQPCGDDAQETTLRRPNQLPPPGADGKTWDRVTASNRLRELERDIPRIEAKIAELRAARDIDVSRLREHGDNSNTPPGMSYEEALQPKIDALRERYQKQINKQQDRLAELKAKISMLKGG